MPPLADWRGTALPPARSPPTITRDHAERVACLGARSWRAGARVGRGVDRSRADSAFARATAFAERRLPAAGGGSGAAALIRVISPVDIAISTWRR